LKQLKIGFDLDEVILFWLFFLKKNAKEVLARLIDQGHLVKIVTARSGFMLFLATITLKIYGLGDIEIVGVGKNGYKYKELIGFHIYVDDKVWQLIAIDGRVEKLYLFGKESKNGFVNLSNWWEIFWEVQWITYG